MDSLLLLSNTINAYMALPEYKDLATHIMSQAQPFFDDIGKYKEEIKKETNDFYIKKLIGYEESGKYVIMDNVGGFRYSVNVTKEKIK